MLIAAYLISFTAILILVVGLGVYLDRKFGLPRKLLVAGALTFVAAQVLHIPLVNALAPMLQTESGAGAQVGPLALSALVLGLLAGLFEETARFILFKFVLKSARSWREAVLVGAGHGGIEAILVAVLGFVTIANMIAYRNVDLSTIPTIPPEQVEALTEYVSTFWSAPAYMAFLALFERAFAISLHLMLSALVMYGFVTNQARWYWLAVILHSAVDALAVYLAGLETNPVLIEGVLGVIAAISLWILFRLRHRFGPQAAPAQTE
jgi:uncharacterized membrane protein YhfC